MTDPVRRRSLAILAAILLLAAALRLVALSRLPPAHYRDVAITALDALRAASGHPRLHYVRDEGLYANLMGLLFLVAGASDVTVRLPGALFGILTCAAVVWLGRVLGAPRAGRYAGFFLAVSLWHVILSRSGFRAVLLPLLMTCSIGLLVAGLRRASLPSLAVSGVALGLCLHTYPSSRFIPFLLPFAVFTGLPEGEGKQTLSEGLRRAWPGLLVFLLAAALVAAPMLAHYLHHPDDFTDAKRIVTVFSPKLAPGTAPGLLLEGVLKTLGMFHVHGDNNLRHNLPGAPMLDPLTGILFLVGLAAAVLGLRRQAAADVARTAAGLPRPTLALLLAWVPIMLLPSALSVEGVPHGLRACAVLPAVMLLAGNGAVLAEETLRRRVGAPAVRSLCLGLAIVMAGWTAWRHFAVWGQDPRLFAEHDGAYRAAARALLEAPPEAQRFLITNGTGFEIYGLPAEVHAYLFEMRANRPILLGAKDAGRLMLEGRTAYVALVRRDDHVLDLIRALNPGAPIQPVTAEGLSVESPVYRVN